MKSKVILQLKNREFICRDKATNLELLTEAVLKHWDNSKFDHTSLCTIPAQQANYIY